MSLYVLREHIIRPACNVRGFLGIWNPLRARGIQGQDRKGGTPFVHALEPLLFDVKKPGFQPLPDRGGRVYLRLRNGEVDGEMFFQRNLVLHNGILQLSALSLLFRPPPWRGIDTKAHVWDPPKEKYCLGMSLF